MMPGQDMGMGSGMMSPGMMGRMHRAMMGMTGGGATMPRHMMKIMFAIMDADGDGTLSFEEVMAIHKRIFNAIDANKDGKVTVEEVEAFMRD
jgi:Ca2+-binding EF-hand superfamily protein